MYKLAVFDVDGTLVSRVERKLLDSTLVALHKLKENGIKIAIASGRPPFAMEPDLISKIDFDYYICSNGTYVEDHNHHKLYDEVLSCEEVEHLALDFSNKDDAILFQFEDHAYVYHGYKRMYHMIDKCLGRVELLIDDRNHCSRHLESLPLAAVAYIKKENLEYYKARYPKFRFESFMENYYDIYPYENSKATGIMHLCDKINIEMMDVIAFGDNLNDLEMIKACGCGVAMNDGLEEVKDVADYVTSDSTKDGIYNACVNLEII